MLTAISRPSRKNCPELWWSALANSSSTSRLYAATAASHAIRAHPLEVPSYPTLLHHSSKPMSPSEKVASPRGAVPGIALRRRAEP